MNFQVEHIDSTKIPSNLTLNISLIKFLKHAAIAGQGPGISLYPTLKRSIGLLLFYQDYIKTGPGLSLVGFKKDPLSDPTELGDFSTIAGKAFSDILAKDILDASYTFTYEAALKQSGYSIKGIRPDFFCVSPLGQFALESKCRKSSGISASLMTEAKVQSQSGSIPVSFSYASVTYNLYTGPKGKFYDPVLPAVPENPELIRALIRNYYQSLLQEFEPLRRRATTRIAQRDFFSFRFPLFGSVFELVIDRSIPMRTSDIKDEPEDYKYEPIFGEYYYVDRDGIGIKARDPN